MRKLAPRDPANVAAVQEIIDQVRSDWLSEPNIVDVGLAIKIAGGVPQVDTLTIRFFVQEKVSEEECRARGLRTIPEEIEEIPTDVTSVVAAPLQVLETRSQRYDTLVGGITVGNTRLNTVGTLAGIFFHNDDGRAVGLTNEHVIVNNIDGQIGDPVAQPTLGFGSQVAIVDAPCCPDGQISFRDVPNPLRDVAAGVFTGAAIAAAASDEIDPHRRGQEATSVSNGERTLRERVQMKIDYSEIPLPGTPYRLGADWVYERETDLRTLTHNVTETRENPHVLREQELLTNRRVYRQGQTVYFLAVVALDKAEEPCPDYHVVAHAVSPTKTRARRTILRPVRAADWRMLREVFENLEVDVENPCFYWGSITLSPVEETGLWSTYLFVQTLNDVLPGTEPTVAARTIGGLLASSNFAAGGRMSNIAYGDICPIDTVANGDFEVVIPSPVE